MQAVLVKAVLKKHMPYNTMSIKILIFLSVSLFSSAVIAEGTKQLRPDSTWMSDLWILDDNLNYTCFATESCGPDQKLYIHIANPGEKVFMGFNAKYISSFSFKIKLDGATVFTDTVNLLNGSPGFIKYYSQAIAGPDILDPHGYPALTFSPAEAGDYSIEFDLPSSERINMRLFDITVIDTTATPFLVKDGRLWSKDWSFEINGPDFATMFILTDDSLVTSINFNQMNGMNFDVTSTQNGCFPEPYPWDSSCRSRHFNHHYAQYKIFINNPDSIEYPTGSPGAILGDTVNVTRGCDGSFTFRFLVSKTGKVNMTIESDLAPGIQPKDLYLIYSVQPCLTTTIFWDGRNALGEIVPCDDSVAITMNYINGLTNLALYDVEVNSKGFIIQLLRPQGPPVSSYWNDTLLADKGGQVQLTGCSFSPPDQGCHTWLMSQGLGECNTINTWWYAASSILDLGRFRIACEPYPPQGIIGPTTICANEAPLFTVDPDPLTGSEPMGYEWLLTDVTTGSVILDSAGAGASIQISFDGFPPGPKRLMVRGRSDLCGYGPWGPDINGILINIIEAPKIINSQMSFLMCSGDTTDILMQSSMPGTTYSYLGTSTSPFITGQSPDTLNPIRQVLLNTGTDMDSVYYYVVPLVAPCPGDTSVFIVGVLPTDTLILPITVSANPACEGMTVTYIMDSVISGPLAVYSWIVNGIHSGTNAPVFSYVPLDGDQVGCTITSPAFCNPDQLATGMEVMMSVLPKLPVSVSIALFPDQVCQGDSVSATAIPINGGSSPAYQWQVNGSTVGTDYFQYSYVPNTGDTVSCLLMSDMTCVMNEQTSDSVVVIVQSNLQVIDTTLCYGIPLLAGGSWQISAGTYYDTLTPPVNCVSIIQTNLQYKPHIPLSLGPDTSICGDPLTLNAFVPGANYLWQDGTTDSILVVTDPGEYNVTVNLGTCSQSDSLTIDKCPVKLWFPNVFTPNGDGLNDTFHPTGWGAERFFMQIFNRWGEMIFETKDLEPGWNGTYKGNLCPEDNYIYISTYEGNSGQAMHSKGSILLQR